MRFYAIRHKPSGFFLPMHKGRAGGSWVEPTEGCQPRLFSEERYAKGFLTVWLQGGVTVKETQDYFGEYDTHWTVTPQPHRKIEDMEIVPMQLIEVLTDWRQVDEEA